jgi:hypothetical protein
MSDRIDELERRVKVIEGALLAIATGAPTCINNDGHLEPLAIARKIFERQQYPNAKDQ